MKMMDTSEAHSLNFLRTIFAAGLIAASCLVMFATEARAAQDTPKNYSHILPLSVSGTQGVVGRVFGPGGVEDVQRLFGLAFEGKLFGFTKRR